VSMDIQFKVVDASDLQSGGGTAGAHAREGDGNPEQLLSNFR
jgi:hypothetical protein